MKIQLSKTHLILGLTAILLTSLGSSYIYAHSQNNENSFSSQQSTSHPADLVVNRVKQSDPVSTAYPENIENRQPLLPSTKNLSLSPPAQTAAYQVIDEMQKYKFSVEGQQVFNPGKLPSTKVNFNQRDLLKVLVNTREYFQKYSQADPDILRSGLLGTQGVKVEDILKTLDFMSAVLQEDIASNRPTRLQDPNFINDNFRVIKWTAHNPQSPSRKQLRITKYAVFNHAGSHTKTATFNIPLYSLKDNLAVDKFYTKYTKQDVLSGIYEPGGKEFGKVEPLVYLTRKGLEEALMEGTVVINFPDGSHAFYNVDRNNEMAYVRGLAATSQKRYWYFRKVDAIKGYGYKIDAKISIEPGVTFAGDVLNIGLGRVVVIEYPQGGHKNLRLGVVADTGGAFLPNLHQLDFLAGIFQNNKDFQQHTQTLPEYATAYILVKK